MNKIKQLFIRACKSENPETRVLSVYRRFYMYYNDKEFYIHVSQIMAKICDTHNLYNARDLVNDLNPENHWKYNLKKDVYYSRFVMRVLMSKIRLSDVNKFDGLSIPAMFRNKKEK